MKQSGFPTLFTCRRNKHQDEAGLSAEATLNLDPEPQLTLTRTHALNTAAIHALLTLISTAPEATEKLHFIIINVSQNTSYINTLMKLHFP